jgi:glutamyl-tRNA synthetase
MSNEVRVRFAPSPTGPLHIGGVRTALYNYLFAKKHKGTFLIRIEDTDQTRFVPGAQDYIMESLKWAGIMPTEGPGIGGEYGPYVQSERQSMYKPYADLLIESGHAYYAFDSSEELKTMRDNATKSGMPNWQYNGITRSSMLNSLTLSSEEVSRRLDAGEPYVIRMKMPRNQDVRFEDMIRSWVVVNTNNVDDKVLFKSDGMPTYHLANIVDDHTMNISHVIRGEEWLPSAPLHILLYQAFGWEAPLFAHLPLLLRPDGNGKLSKRDGDRLGFPVFPLNWITSEGELYSGYKEAGYLPEAFINMLAFLGWNPGTQQELFTLEELVDAFSLDRVSKSGAKFDVDKTRWFQQQYLKTLDNHILGEELLSFYPNESVDTLSVMAGLMKERAVFVHDIVTEGDYLINKPTDYDKPTVAKKWKPESAGIMAIWLTILSDISDFSTENVETSFKAYLEEQGLSFGAAMPQFRLLLTGKGMGPGIFEIASFLGKDECILRMKAGLNFIK